jgi:type II secretory pathway component PulF
MISDVSLLDFCRALVSTVRSGLTLSDAFETLAKSRRHRRLAAGAARLTAQGKFLHEAFAAQRVFPPLFIALLRAGEEGGKTDEFLELYADCLEVRVKFRRQIERLLVYPLFVLVLAGALFLLVSFKVVPMVMEPLMKSGAALPAQTFLFISLAERLAQTWPVILGVGALALLVLRAFLVSGPGRKLRGLAGHWLPLFRFAASEVRLYYIYTTMALLMKAGLAPGAMMDILLQFSQDDLVTRRRLRRAAEMLSGGTSFARSVADIMQEDDRQAMEIAEKAGRLDDTLLSRAKLHYDRHLHRMKLLVTAFNISTLVAIALVCFALIVSVIWPAVSVLGGGQNPLQALDTPAEGQPPRKLTPEEARTKSFNEKQGGKVMNFMNEYGAVPARSGRSASKSPAAMTPMKKMQFKPGSATNIQPSNINGR